MSDENLVKVVFCQKHEGDEEKDVECPWALPLGNNRYQLKNFPFFYYGISFDDIFEALPTVEDDPRPYITRVLEKSGHKTIRIFLNKSIKESEKSKEILSSLTKMECGYEGDGERFFVINIQPRCDFEKVCEFISNGELEWEHADPTYEELFPDEA